MAGRTGWTAVIYVPVFLLLAALAGCRSLPPENAAPVRVASRFLLTFDDGPSISEGNNPTVSILEQLANNGVQPNIKAIFFVQTRNRNGGGTEYGRKLLRREHAENHLIGVHSGSPRGHVSHVHMPPEELQESLWDAAEDIAAAAGNAPLFVRPPFWAYTANTLALYGRNRLNMLLSDVKAYDGVIWGVNFSLRRRSNIRNELLRVREEISLGQIPVVDGAAPIVVTFHDPNTFTASHMEEYLQILVEEAGRVGLPLSIKPFYDDPTELARAALRRTVHMPDELPASTIADKTPNRPLPLEPSADNAITLPRPDDSLPPRNHGG